MRFTLLACFVVGAVLRFTNLTKESFWLDEGWLLHVIDRASVFDVVREAAKDIHPPLQYILLWGWARVFGESDAALRSLSAVFATASIPATWALARRLVAPRAALVATVIVALSPLLLLHAHDAKQYSLVLLLATISTERFLAFAQRGSHRALAGWAVATILLAYTHVIGVTAVLAQDALILVGIPRAVRHGRALLVPWFIGHVAVILAVAPVVPSLVAATPGFQGFPGSQSPHILWRAFKSIEGGRVATMLMVALSAAGLMLGRLRGRAVPRGLRASLVLAAIMILGPWAASALTFPSFARRLLIPGIPPLAIGLGVGLMRLASPARRGLPVALAVCAIAVGISSLHPRVEREQWREASAFIGSNAKPGDAVLSLGVPDGILLRRYLPKGGPEVLDGSAKIPSPSPGGARLFVVSSSHTEDLEVWRAALVARGWRESASTPFVLMRVLRYDP